jgi:hypothetical protein
MADIGKMLLGGVAAPSVQQAVSSAVANTDEEEKKKKTMSKGMKKGGMVSASKRADGCAIKGKTRGKMV